MMRIALSFFIVALLSATSFGQTAKPDNPIKLKLELIVVTCSADAEQGTIDKGLIKEIEATVEKGKSKPWFELQDAVQNKLPKSSDKVYSSIDAFSLQSFHDLEQWAKFGMSHPGYMRSTSSGRIPPRVSMGEATVKATPWVRSGEQFGLGVTVERQLPVVMSPQRTSGYHPSDRETHSFTSNTILDANQADVINVYRHVESNSESLFVVIARVSKP
ncbi:hypothetical protein ACYFX5_24700 [Bremerella sp. T1]|uniref:hypothetical protein n=1 Tax=Bremerella sp. TYQ1 TaxID=3119568 RepID=UPI001CD01C3E|nr:hypothetical protein [Bremerella volcania]UBM36222.1 hypothetical protein LA756_26640 [Bremerella volcania]